MPGCAGAGAMTPPQRPRILMTADAVGGVWSYATSLSRELCRRGFKVTLMTLGPTPRSDQLCELTDIQGLAFEPTDLALEWMDPEAANFDRALERLTEIERRVEPDIVHLNGFREAQGDWNARRLVVAHSCVRSWWLACRGEEPSEPSWVEYIANVRGGLAVADAWVAPSAAFRDVIAKLYAPPIAGRVIWNGVDGCTASGRKQPFILAAGRLWDEAKNLLILDRIAPRLPWPIRLAGACASPDHLNSIATSRLEHLGELSREALRAEMAHASILVAPSLYEPFGLTVLEAARAGCALVLSDSPSLRELWGGAALFVDPRDDRQLQNALASLIRDGTRLRHFQRRAIERSQRYSLAAMADSYAALYGELARTEPATWVSTQSELGMAAS
jgi:glycosyltransferase involved in cell wall biosynthesis